MIKKTTTARRSELEGAATPFSPKGFALVSQILSSSFFSFSFFFLSVPSNGIGFFFPQ